MTHTLLHRMSNLPQYVSCISRTTFLMVDTLYVCIDAYPQHNRAATKAPHGSNNGQIQLHRLAFAPHVNGTYNNIAIRHKFQQTNLVGACDDGASSPLMSRLFKRRNVLSLAGVDTAAAAGAAPRARPLPAPSGACCSLRLDGGEPALPPPVDAECAAPPENGGGVARAVRAPT